MQADLTLSPSFRRRIAGVWGHAGRAWVERLPAVVADCAERWDLSIQSPVPDPSYGFLIQAITAGGTPAILKLSVPNPELFAEMAALRAFREGPVVEMLEADRQLGAILLQRLTPATPLSKLDDDEEATRIAASLIRDLPVPHPPDPRFPTLEDWARAFKRLRLQHCGGTGPLPERMVERAEGLFRELHDSSPHRMLLHGDLHHENVLADRERGWVAIDPKGVVGDPAFEAARWQINPWPHLLSMDRPGQVAARRFDILSSMLGQDRTRLLGWAFFGAMLSACWSAEEDGDWEYPLACAELFEKLAEG